MTGTEQTVPGAAVSSRQVWAALWVVYLVWGSTYLGIKLVVDAGIPPLLGMGTRFVTSGLLLAGFVCLRRGPSALRLDRRSLRASASVGVLLLMVGNGGVAYAEQTVTSGLAALIVGAVPLWLVLMRLVDGQRPGIATWAGVAVGFLGIALISLTRGGVGGVAWWGVVVLLVATLGWSLGSFLSPRLGLPADPLVATAWEMLLGGGIMLVVALASGSARGFEVASVPTSGWIGLAYLITVGSLAGYTAYVWLLEHAPLSLVSTYAYVNPVVAVALGWALLGEPITRVILVGGLIVVAGVALVVRGERSSPAPVPGAAAQAVEAQAVEAQAVEAREVEAREVEAQAVEAQGAVPGTGRDAAAQRPLTVSRTSSPS